MSEPEQGIGVALREMAGQAATPRLDPDALWRAGRRRRRAAIITSVAAATTTAAAATLIPLAIRNAPPSPPAVGHPHAWKVVHSPNPGPASASAVLKGVSCASATSCTAVGDYWPGTNPYNPHVKTLIEWWNGTAWSVVPSPNLGPASGSYYDQLNGVSCASATACTAVGASGVRSLVESWNGKTWSVVPSPPGDLNGVSCASAASCTAVGTSGVRPLVESWNGKTWSVVESWNRKTWSVGPSPSRGEYGGDLNGVSCVSAASCTAVGSKGVSGGRRYGTLVESWNGTRWSVVPSPNQGNSDRLTGVSCVSASSCTAVGQTPSGTLIESWNGKTWSVVPSPNQGNTDGLNGVSCAWPASCTVAGYRGVTAVKTKTLIESN